MTDDVRDGSFEAHYDNGRLKEEGILKDGVRHGLCVSYYESGELRSKLNWRDGLRHGEYKYYNKDGRVTGEGTAHSAGASPNEKTKKRPVRKRKPGRPVERGKIQALLFSEQNWLRPGELHLLNSFLEQLNRGRRLSWKQQSTVKKIRKRVGKRKTHPIYRG